MQQRKKNHNAIENTLPAISCYAFVRPNTTIWTIKSISSTFCSKYTFVHLNDSCLLRYTQGSINMLKWTFKTFRLLVVMYRNLCVCVCFYTRTISPLTFFNTKHAIVNLDNINFKTFEEYLREPERTQTNS